MSQTYIPLYRKYRPQKFADVVGQIHVVKALENAIKLNRISHAYLFCGPRGTGKTSMARILAKSLNCKEGPTVDPCGSCPSCIDIQNSTPTDVIEIDAASNRLVEDAQNIIEKIQYAPSFGKFKIFVIDEVHMLSNHAFNALLKTLEEPPKNVVFILATTEAHKVLETIVSRCQRFDFERISTNEIVDRLKYVCEKENIKITENALKAIASNSQGAMRDSLSLLDQVSILGEDSQIDENLINRVLGKISKETLFDFADCILKHENQKILSLLNKIFELGNEPLNIVENFIQYLRNLLVIKNCEDKLYACELTAFDSENFEKFKNQSDQFSNEKLVFLIEKFAQYSREIKNSTNRFLWLEVCLLDVVNLEFESISSLVEKVNELSAKIENVNFSNGSFPLSEASFDKNTVEKKQSRFLEKSETSESEIENRVEKPEKTFEQSNKIVSKTNDQNEIWKGILQKIESVPSKMFYMNLARPVSISEKKVVICFKKDIFVKQAKEDSKRIPFLQACKLFFDVEDVSVEVVVKDFDSENHKVTISEEEKHCQIEPEPEEKIRQETDDAKYIEEKHQSDDNFEKPRHHESFESDQTKMILELFDGKLVEER